MIFGADELLACHDAEAVGAAEQKLVGHIPNLLGVDGLLVDDDCLVQTELGVERPHDRQRSVAVTGAHDLEDDLAVVDHADHCCDAHVPLLVNGQGKVTYFWQSVNASLPEVFFAFLTRLGQN